MDWCPLLSTGVGVIRPPSDSDIEQNWAVSNNKEVEEDCQVHRWEDRGVMKLQSVYPVKSVVRVKSCWAVNENFVME